MRSATIAGHEIAAPAHVTADMQVPAVLGIDGPVASPIDGPIASPIDGPVASPIEGPIASPVDGPIDGPVDGPIEGSLESPDRLAAETSEITETFRNDSAAALEGVYQFPLPPDAQIDDLALDVAGGFVDGAFVDKQRGARIWRGVIDRARPHPIARPSQDILWVEGRWRDPALLDWKRGGRFELRVYPIPAHGARTIKLAYTQVVAPRGAWRQYSYPLPHSRDGSTVADELSVDVELRGALPGQVRARLRADRRPRARRGQRAHPAPGRLRPARRPGDRVPRRVRRCRAPVVDVRRRRGGRSRRQARRQAARRHRPPGRRGPARARRRPPAGRGARAAPPPAALARRRAARLPDQPRVGRAGRTDEPDPGAGTDPAAGTARAPVRGTLDITALGAHRAIPFELTGARAVVGRVAVRLEQRFEDLDGTPVQLYNGPDRRIIPDRRPDRVP